MEQLHRRKEHVKVVSDLSHTSGGAKHDFTNNSNSDVKPKKEALCNFKKQKKEKGEITIETKESKAASAGNPLNNLLNLKSPTSADKKSLKNLVVGPTTKRRKLEEKENVDARNKKKSKKLQITPN
jgi:hypothetical protein